MKVIPTNIPEVFIIEPQVFSDERGFFSEMYNQKKYVEIGIREFFVQDNLSQSKKGVLRGFHYQAPPFDQGKLVSVLRGKVLDVALDIRLNSPTYGQYVAVELSEKNKRQLWIPSGFAHGFLTLEDDTLFSYKCTNYYSPEHDGGIRWDDSDVNMEWPDIGCNFTISEKDAHLPTLENTQSPFIYSL